MELYSEKIKIRIAELNGGIEQNPTYLQKAQMNAELSTLARLLPQVKELEDENFSLSAHQCNDPCSGENGYMRCKIVDYWKERCKLADKCLMTRIDINAEDDELTILANQIEAHNAYNEFMSNNKEPK